MQTEGQALAKKIARAKNRLNTLLEEAGRFDDIEIEIGVMDTDPVQLSLQVELKTVLTF